MNDIQRRKSGTEDLSLKFVLTVFQAVWTLEFGEFGEVISEASEQSSIFITFGWSLGISGHSSFCLQGIWFHRKAWPEAGIPGMI